MKPVGAVALFAVVTVVLAGCGGASAPALITSAPSGASPHAPVGATIDTTLDSYSITLSTETTTAPFTFAITNVGDGPHGLALEDANKQLLATTGEIGRTKTDTLVVEQLAPGTYTYFCPIVGHRREGMFGTLTVQ
jgi:plastocyanin